MSSVSVDRGTLLPEATILPASGLLTSSRLLRCIWHEGGTHKQNSDGIPASAHPERHRPTMGGDDSHWGIQVVPHEGAGVLLYW